MMVVHMRLGRWQPRLEVYLTSKEPGLCHQVSCHVDKGAPTMMELRSAMDDVIEHRVTLCLIYN